MKNGKYNFNFSLKKVKLIFKDKTVKKHQYRLL